MKRRLKLISFLALLVACWGWGGVASAALIYTPVDFSAFFNGSNQGRDSSFPYGSMVFFGGIPFDIPSGLNTWDSNTGSGTMSVTIPVGVYGVQEVHTLINTSWGQVGPLTALEFYGSDGAYYREDLVGNSDIRDWNQASWTNSINGTTTINVFTNLGGNHRIDKQLIALPIDFADEVLQSIVMSDWGGGNYHRAYLYGVTVGVVPLPGAAWLLMTGLGLLPLAGRRKASLGK